MTNKSIADKIIWLLENSTEKWRFKEYEAVFPINLTKNLVIWTANEDYGIEVKDPIPYDFSPTDKKRLWAAINMARSKTLHKLLDKAR